MYFKVGSTGMELSPNYRSHKTVAALKITTIQYDTFDDQPVTRLIFDDVPSLQIANTELHNKPVPEAGMYLVVYEDGYFSFSPAKAFESGYTAMNPLPSAPETPILRHFSFSHLPSRLQGISEPLCRTAEAMNAILPDGPEKSAGLRKLLEAKDCFVRAALP